VPSHAPTSVDLVLANMTGEVLSTGQTPGTSFACDGTPLPHLGLSKGHKLR
jgi:hypothetical protein